MFRVVGIVVIRFGVVVSNWVYRLEGFRALGRTNFGFRASGLRVYGACAPPTLDRKP